MNIKSKYEDNIISVRLTDDIGNVVETSEDLDFHMISARIDGIEDSEDTIIMGVISAINSATHNALYFLDQEDPESVIVDARKH